MKLTGEEADMPEDPHARAPEEDPEQNIGEVIQDPWEDPDQAEWPNEYVDIANGRVSD